MNREEFFNKNLSWIEKLYQILHGKLIIVQRPLIDILEIVNVYASVLRKDCRWRTPHSQHK